MEIIRCKIEHILPSLQSDTLDSLINQLDNIGVTSESDLKYVQESDITSILRPIQARKLIEAWKQLDSESPLSNENHLKSETNATNLSEILPLDNHLMVKLPLPKAITQSIPLDWTENFAIPWEKMSEELLNALKEGRRPTPKARREFVKKTSEDILKICQKPGKKNLSKIARKAIETYPALSDVWCNEIVAGGCESLIRSFVVKFENLNRRDVFTSIKRNLKKAEIEDGQKNHNHLNASSIYGCPNWQPRVLPLGENSESQKAKQTQMIRISSSIKPENELDEQSLSLLKDTFFSQRRDINNLKTIFFLMSSWPLLFTEKGFFHHFNLLTGINILDVMKNASETKVLRIVHFFKSLPNKRNNMNEIFDIYKEETRDEFSEFELMILLLLEHFNEKSEDVFISVDSSLTARDVETMALLPITPCLVSFNDDSVATSYMVAVDKKIIIENIKSFEKGFFMVLAAYYILNIQYPERACATLEFIQRCFLRMNPNKGYKSSKRMKKNSAMSRKVLSLLNKLMDFEWY